MKLEAKHSEKENDEIALTVTAKTHKKDRLKAKGESEFPCFISLSVLFHMSIECKFKLNKKKSVSAK